MYLQYSEKKVNIEESKKLHKLVIKTHKTLQTSDCVASQ
jgi:hypothetical protein